MMRLPSTSRLFVLMTANYSADVMSTQFTSTYREARQVPTNCTYHCTSPKRPDTMAAQYPIRNLRSSKGLEEKLQPKGIQIVERTSYDHPET